MSDAAAAARCGLCPHECVIPEGGRGFCQARVNPGGRVIAESYGKITGLALDPIEKKPLKMYYPGSMILSVGSYGCNLRCPFCQNHEIALPAGLTGGAGEIPAKAVTPAALAALALEYVPQGNIGLAFTYNEPLINYEFLRDTANLNSANGLKNILVTNGFLNPSPFERLIIGFHAANIDLKGFSQDFYDKIGGNAEIVKNNITTAHKHCHVEVTTLIIEGENDHETGQIAQFLAQISPEIPFHITRFFPRNKYSSRLPTQRETILRCVEIAKKYLRNVFAGNL